MASMFKKTKAKLEILTYYQMLLMIEEIRGGMRQPTHRYAKANNKYLKNYDKSIEPSYLKYLDANNLYGWAMSQELPISGFMWYDDYLLNFNEEFIKNCDQNSEEGFFFEVEMKYPKTL